MGPALLISRRFVLSPLLHTIFTAGVCIYACLCAYMYVCLFVCMYVCACIYNTGMYYVSVHLCVYIIWKYVCTNACM